MYPPELQDSLAKLEASRDFRRTQSLERITPQVKDTLLHAYHPDYQDRAMAEIKVGANAGESAPVELVNLLHGDSRINPDDIDLTQPDFVTDVLVVGSGGAGLTAALFAHDAGAKVMIATKLRNGDSNTIMATGIAAPTGEKDSPSAHYLDTMGGSNFTATPELVKALVTDGPEIIAWFERLGVRFDKDENGAFKLGAAGGYSRRRIHSCGDFTGLDIMRVLKDEIHKRAIDVLEFAPAVELILDTAGHCAGAILFDYDRERFLVVQAKAVILTTGGIGRLHLRGAPTTNHYGATADGLVMAYRAGAKLLHQDSIQYHPTGVVYPNAFFGQLVSERCRGSGGQLVNHHGDRFVYELETRDVVASSIIKACAQGDGIETASGHRGVWLDTVTIREEDRWKLQNLHKRFLAQGIDIWQKPLLIYPTQHYQNGGVLIDPHGRTTVPHLYAAGELAGGIHGRNRLAANSLLDIFVFGKRAGIHAAKTISQTQTHPLMLDHLREYAKNLHNINAESGVLSPALLPEYRKR